MPGGKAPVKMDLLVGGMGQKTAKKAAYNPKAPTSIEVG
jgi:hypothetical protein